MDVDVLMINPRWQMGKRKWEVGGNSNRMAPPLDMGWIAKLLKKEKISFKIIDANVNRYSDEEIISLMKENPAKIVITTSEPYDLYRCMSMIKDHLQIHQTLVKQIRETLPDSKIAILGPHGTSLPHTVFEMNPDLDYVVRGDPEYATFDLIKAVISKKSVDKVQGVSHKKDGKVINNPTELIKDLEELGYPDYTELEMEKYMTYRKKNHGLRSTLIVSSRGCPSKCIYCFKGFMTDTFRARSAKNVIEEIDYLYQNYKIEHVGFYDDNFTINKQRILDLCTELKKKPYRITWDAEQRIEVTDENIIKEMSEAGCIDILFGIESFVKEVQIATRKVIAFDRINQIANWCAQYGIHPTVAIQLGLPGDSWETIKQNMKVINTLKVPVSEPLITRIYPSTQLWHMCKKEGLIKDDSFQACVDQSGLAFTKFKDRAEYFRALRYYHTRINWHNFKMNASPKNIIMKTKRHGPHYVLKHGFRMTKKLVGIMGDE